MDIGTEAIGSLFDHTLDPVVNPANVIQFEQITPASGVDLVNGRVASLKSDGTTQLGLSSQSAMPLWIQGVRPNAPKGALGGKGAYAYVGAATIELLTSEFDSSKTYAPNTACTVDSDGKLTPVTDHSTEATVLIVSRGAKSGKEAMGLGVNSGFQLHAGQNYLFGWCVYQPVW